PGMYLTSFRVQLVPKEILRTTSPTPAMSRVAQSLAFMPVGLASAKGREASSDTDSLRSASFRTRNRDHQTCRSLSYRLLPLFRNGYTTRMWTRMVLLFPVFRNGSNLFQVEADVDSEAEEEDEDDAKYS
ncbi:hypothetical protein Tco_1268166, partial [Tanacetum coccineum]